MKRRLPFVLLFVLVAAAILHMGFARERPDVASLCAWLLSWTGLLEAPDAAERFVLGDIRAPRLLVAIFGGGALALAGTVMQATFRNPLASPDIIGTAAGAAFGGALLRTSGTADSC